MQIPWVSCCFPIELYSHLPAYKNGSLGARPSFPLSDLSQRKAWATLHCAGGRVPPIDSSVHCNFPASATPRYTLHPPILTFHFSFLSNHLMLWPLSTSIQTQKMPCTGSAVDDCYHICRDSPPAGNKAAETHGDDGRLRAPRQHHIRIPALDVVGRSHECVVGGGARRADAVVWPHEPLLYGHQCSAPTDSQKD